MFLWFSLNPGGRRRRRRGAKPLNPRAAGGAFRPNHPGWWPPQEIANGRNTRIRLRDTPDVQVPNMRPARRDFGFDCDAMISQVLNDDPPIV